MYRYPDFGVCLYEDNGCDSLDDHIAKGCVNSSNSTEFGLSTAVYRGQELSPTDGVWIPDTTEETEKNQSIEVDPRFTGPEVSGVPRVVSHFVRVFCNDKKKETFAQT